MPKAFGIGAAVEDETFARANIVRNDVRYKECKKCGHIKRSFVPPATVDWKVQDYDGGSDHFGDFTWLASSQEALRIDASTQRAGKTIL